MESQAERKIEVRSIFRSLLSMRESILFIVIVLSFIGMSFASPYFLSPGNLESMFLGLSVEGIICIGMVILLVSGGLDLSVGSNLAFTGVVVGLSMTNGIPILPSIIIALIAAFLAGFLNGILIAKMNLNPFITTLGMQMFLKGAMLLAANGKSVLGLPDGFNNIGQGRLIGIQYPVFILIILVIVFEIVLRRSRILRTSYYVGGNENAARLSGIKVSRVKIAIYSLTGIMAGIAGHHHHGPVRLLFGHHRPGRGAAGARRLHHRRGEPQRRGRHGARGVPGRLLHAAALHLAQPAERQRLRPDAPDGCHSHPGHPSGPVERKAEVRADDCPRGKGDGIACGSWAPRGTVRAGCYDIPSRTGLMAGERKKTQRFSKEACGMSGLRKGLFALAGTPRRSS